MDKQGKLIVVSAPSGSGKTTLVKHLLEKVPGLAFSVSATSRKMRAGEKHGKDYFFMSADEFRQKIQQGAFLEWEEVYPGIFYGSLRSEVEKLTTRGLHPVFDVDVVGGLNIKQLYGPQALSIFVMVPSIEVLAQRLYARSTDSDESLQQRLSKASHEMNFANQFDKIVVNDNLETAQNEIVYLVNEFIQQ